MLMPGAFFLSGIAHTSRSNPECTRPANPEQPNGSHRQNGPKQAAIHHQHKLDSKSKALGKKNKMNTHGKDRTCDFRETIMVNTTYVMKI